MMVVSYADDTTILFKIHKNNLDDDVTLANSMLERILEVFDFLKLTINVSKTQFILFRSALSRIKPDNLNIFLRGEPAVFF